MKKFTRSLILTPLIVFALLARGQVQLQHTNSLALEWSYPTNGVSPDLGFILYDSPTLANLPANWPILTIVQISNQVSWNGVIYPQIAGSNEIFLWPITPTNVQMYFTIAASNVTGLGEQAIAPYPVVTPLENLTNFLMIEHP